MLRLNQTSKNAAGSWTVNDGNEEELTMMDKEEMLLAIKANDAISKLDSLITSITGKEALTGSKFENMFLISELLYRNCSFYDPCSDDSFAKFMDIVNDEKLTPEEKYHRFRQSNETEDDE